MSERENNVYQPVYLQRLAGYLMTRGFILEAIGPNPKDPIKHVFYFRDTPDIQQAIQNYLAQRKAR